ncbi:sulfite exporter TauE/SafE family protein [bacterium]|nr:sulfite exporter TauE/SafE family protein [bacterium]
MNLWQYIILYVTGVFAGICNVLAGGGSLVTIPLLIFFGLESADANGTNRLAIAIQNIFAVAGFKRKGFSNPRFCIMLILPALPGVIIGAITASSISDLLFRRILSAVMLLVLILILTKTKINDGSKVDENNLSSRKKILIMIAFAGIGFYSGFIQAGVGFITIAALTGITGLDLVKTNSHKVFIIGVMTWVAVVVFIFLGRIIWSLSLVLAAGTATGGWLGSHIAVMGGDKWIRRFLTVAVIAMALKLSGIF